MPKYCVVSIMPRSPYQPPRPQSSGRGSNAPRACLSNPTTSPISWVPEAMAARAVSRDAPPVAQPLITLVNGSPVRPSRLTIVSGLPAESEPPTANWMSGQPTPASASAARAALTAICSPDTSSLRPNGWMPMPAMARPPLIRSALPSPGAPAGPSVSARGLCVAPRARGKRVGRHHDPVVAEEWLDDQPHRHADAVAVRRRAPVSRPCTAIPPSRAT